MCPMLDPTSISLNEFLRRIIAREAQKFLDERENRLQHFVMLDIL